jgi:hypothetical protein
LFHYFICNWLSPASCSVNSAHKTSPPEGVWLITPQVDPCSPIHLSLLSPFYVWVGTKT